MLVVLDFDGTLVKENSSRVCEKLLIDDCENVLARRLFGSIFFSRTYLNLLLAKMFAVPSYLLKTDFRRTLILSIVQKYRRRHTTKYILRKVARSLHINDALWKCLLTRDVEIVILSNGLDIIVNEFCRLNTLGVEHIFASRTSICDDRIMIEYEFFHKKHLVLEIISRTLKPDSILFISDNEEDIASMNRLKCPKIHVLVLLGERKSRLLAV